MSPFDPRIVVMQPGRVAEAIVVREGGPAGKPPEGLVAGQDCVLYVARGRGTVRIAGLTSPLHENMIITAPAGAFPILEMGDDHELYVLALRDAPGDPRAFRGVGAVMARALSPEAGAMWYERMQEYAELAESDAFRAADLRQIKRDLADLVWLRDGRDVHDTLHNVFHHVWNRLDGPLSIDELAGAAGYTPNYLNDLSRTHTGRSLGRWIADMRMARARSYLEITDEAIADVGAACGYDDPAYFSRAFRRAHNVSPVTWRVAARPDDARHPNVTLTMDDIKATQRRAAPAPRVYSIAS